MAQWDSVRDSGSRTSGRYVLYIVVTLSGLEREETRGINKRQNVSSGKLGGWELTDNEKRIIIVVSQFNF